MLLIAGCVAAWWKSLKFREVRSLLRQLSRRGRKGEASVMRHQPRECHNDLSKDQCPLWVCAVQRRRFPVGAKPTRQPLQPEATGAVMEETKRLKLSVRVSSPELGGRPRGPVYRDEQISVIAEVRKVPSTDSCTATNCKAIRSPGRR
jgi:hypothetical protein